MRALLFLYLLLVTAGVAFAADGGPAAPFDAMRQTLSAASTSLADESLSPRDLERINGRLEAVRKRLSDVRERAAAQLEDQKSRRRTLGSPPKSGEQPETPEIARERSKIDAAIARWDGQVKQADLLLQQTSELLKSAAASANEAKASTLVTRKQALSGTTRRAELDRQVSRLPGALAAALLAGGRDFPERLAAAETLLPLAVLLAALVVLAAYLRGLVDRRLQVRQPAERRRAPTNLTALLHVLRDGVLPAAVIAAAAGAMIHLTGPPAAMSRLVASFAGWTALYLIVSGWVGAIEAAPRQALRRAVPDPAVLSGAARHLRWFARFALLSLLLRSTADVAGLGATVYEYAQFAVRLAAAVPLVLLLAPALWRVRRQRARKSTLTLRAIVALLALNPLFVFAGYGPLADWLFFGLIGTLAILGLGRLLHNAAREGIGLLMRRRMREIKSAAGDAQFDVARGSIGRALSFGLMHLVFWAVAVFALLKVWGVEGMGSLASSEFFGRQIAIGSVTISFLDALLAAVAFAVGIVLTRLGQHSVDNRILKRARLDPGTRTALRTFVGYAGFLVATLVSVTALGIDLSHLALIAGALSVGVGFGLQTIVNNFVSGIILLVERPVKTGDWVKVGAYEGLVRHIRVRATEIETFQRSSVLIPNSEMISEAVVNWTFNDSTGRVDVSVGVDVGADPKEVFAILEKIMRDHPLVLNAPTPRAFLRSVSQGALNFELWAYMNVRDSERKIRVESELLARIVEAFRENAIPIALPFPVLEAGSGGVVRLPPRNTQQDVPQAS